MNENIFLTFISIVILAVMLTGLVAINKHLASIDYKTNWQDGAWDDSEYEMNRQCSFLVGEELTKCKAYFNINQ